MEINSRRNIGGTDYYVNRILHMLTQGSHQSTVYLVKAPHPYQFEKELQDRVDENRLIVLKHVKLDKNVFTGNSRNEKLSMLKRLTDLDHQNVLKYFGWSETGSSSPAHMEFIVHMEYCSQVSLQSYIDSKDKKVTVNEQFILRVAKDVLSGLCYLHKLEPPVIHTDIKADNIFVTMDDHFRIGDMDDCISKKSQDSLTLSSIRQYGTALHMSPEMCRICLGKSKAKVPSNTDVWSLGCMLVDILTNVNGNIRYVDSKGNFTGENSSSEVMIKAVQHMTAVIERNSVPDLSQVPAQYHRLLTKCLEVDFKKRSSSHDMLELVQGRRRDLEDYIGVDVGTSGTRWYIAKESTCTQLEEGSWNFRTGLHLLPSAGLFHGADYQTATGLAKHYQLPLYVVRNTILESAKDEFPGWSFLYSDRVWKQDKELDSHLPPIDVKDRITVHRLLSQENFKVISPLDVYRTVWVYLRKDILGGENCVIAVGSVCFGSTDAISATRQAAENAGYRTSTIVPDFLGPLLGQKELWSSQETGCNLDVFVVDVGAMRKPIQFFLRQKNAVVEKQIREEPYGGVRFSGIDALHALSQLSSLRCSRGPQWKKSGSLVATRFLYEDFSDVLLQLKNPNTHSKSKKSETETLNMEDICKVGHQIAVCIGEEIRHIMKVCKSVRYQVKDFRILVFGRASDIPGVMDCLGSQFMGYVIRCHADDLYQTPAGGAALCGQLIRDCAEADRAALIATLEDTESRFLYNRGQLLVCDDVGSSTVDRVRQLIEGRPTVIPELWHLQSEQFPHLAAVCRRGSDGLWLENTNVDNDDHKWQLIRIPDSPLGFALFNFGTQKWLTSTDESVNSLVLSPSDDPCSLWRLMKVGLMYGGTEHRRDESEFHLLLAPDAKLVVDIALEYDAPNTPTPLKAKKWVTRDSASYWRLVRAY